MSYHTIIFQFLSIGRNATITLQKTGYCADKLFVCCIRLHTQYLFSVSRSMNIWVECRVESVDAVIQYCIAICRYRDTNSVIGIISGMFFTFVNEWNTVCKIPRPKFSVQFGVDFLYICCSFIIGKTCQKCCIYGAQNEMYIEGWTEKGLNLLIYKRLCNIWVDGSAKRNVYVGLIRSYI